MSQPSTLLGAIGLDQKQEQKLKAIDQKFFQETDQRVKQIQQIEDRNINLIFDWAVNERLSRMGLLGCTIARLSSAVPYGWCINLGRSKSLACYVLAVGESGAGKSEMLHTVEDMINAVNLQLPHHGNYQSGEALLESFMEYQEVAPSGESGGKRQLELKDPQDRACFVAVDELDTFNGRKSASTKVSGLASWMRTAWSGGRLEATKAGTNSAGKQRHPVPRGTYRIGAYAAGTHMMVKDLLHDYGKGDATRWIVMPADDTYFDDADSSGLPTQLERLWLREQWDISDGLNEIDNHELYIERPIREEVDRNKRAGVSKLASDREDRLGGHVMQIRLRVAAIIGWIRGHPGILDETDWHIARIIEQQSDATVDWHLPHAEKEEIKDAKRVGSLYGERTATSQNVCLLYTSPSPRDS